MENASVKVVKRGDVFVMTMQAGENRFNDTFLTHVNEALDFIEKSEGAAALVTTSSDPKYFSLGLDMACLLQEPTKTVLFLESYQHLLARMVSFPMPTVAAINGHCTAGGGFWAMCHDYKLVAETKGYFFMNEIDLGIPFAPGMAKVFEHKLPNPNTVRDVAILGKRYSLVETVPAGIFDASVPANNLLDRAISVAQLMAPKATHRNAMSKIKNELYEKLMSSLKDKISVDVLAKPKKAKL